MLMTKNRLYQIGPSPHRIPKCPQHTTAWYAKEQDSAPNTWSDAASIQKSSIMQATLQATPKTVASAPERSNFVEAVEDGPRQVTPSNIPGEGTSEDDDEEEEDIESLRDGTMKVATRVVAGIYESYHLSSLEYVARGGYNHVWLVTCSMNRPEGGSQANQDKKFILRISRGAPSLQPYQIRHEIACLRFLRENVPGILAPKVYAWDDGTSNLGPSFIAQEFIEGQRLSVVWPDLMEEQKTNISREIANVVADLGETRFRSIGGLALDAPAGPTIEAAKIFNGRAKFHSPEFYSIGPYTDSKDYIRSCYDREIYYYTHADEDDISAEAFEQTSVADFVAQLKQERDALLNDDSIFQDIDTEPLVLVHEDFHAGNMLVRDGHLVGVLDWEFSGVYPLSELLGAVSILQISGAHRDDWTAQEEMKWQDRYLDEVERVIRQRGWKEQDIAMVLGNGHQILHKARSIMFPKEN